MQFLRYQLLEIVDIIVSEKVDIRECVEDRLSEVEHEETRELIGVQDMSEDEFKLRGRGMLD